MQRGHLARLVLIGMVRVGVEVLEPRPFRETGGTAVMLDTINTLIRAGQSALGQEAVWITEPRALVGTRPGSRVVTAPRAARFLASLRVRV